MHAFYPCIPIFKYHIVIANDKEPLHNKSLVFLSFLSHSHRDLKFSIAILISSLTRWNSDQGLPAGSSNPQCSFLTFVGKEGNLRLHHYIM